MLTQIGRQELAKLLYCNRTVCNNENYQMFVCIHMLWPYNMLHSVHISCLQHLIWNYFCLHRAKGPKDFMKEVRPIGEKPFQEKMKAEMIRVCIDYILIIISCLRCLSISIYHCLITKTQFVINNQTDCYCIDGL